MAGSLALILEGQAAGEINFEVTNIRAKPKRVDLIIDVSNIPDFQAVRLDLGDELGARWASVDGFHNARTSGVAWSGGSVVMVTDSVSATVAGIPMAGSETQTVTLLVDAPSVETAEVTVYEASDADSAPPEDAIVGGNTYIFTTPEENVYLPVILANN